MSHKMSAELQVIYSSAYFEWKFYINMGENFNYYSYYLFKQSVSTTAETVVLNAPCVHTHLFIGSWYSVTVEKW
jgi:hypothetical protein